MTEKNAKNLMTKRKLISIVLNFSIFAFSSLAVFLACFFARRDGYYSWHTRLFYFTQQSNLWIGILSLVFAIFLLKKNTSEKSMKILSCLKFVFTISITITCIIFCTLLAPFADFNLWSFSSVLTHVVVPVLSIVDFFTCKEIKESEKKNIYFSFLPPLVYFVFASILCVFKVDFGRGDAFPYFFMDFYSDVGLFGFKASSPPQMGSFYWMIFFFVFIYGLSFLFHKLHKIVSKKRNGSK
ncbi:MAG: Pr6Pr family membrane protein [Clostridia bacterium]|nr:Pr6Pr family membrane protein [Clostridia bacterium]